MDLRSLSLGERIAAGSGAAFFLFLFLSWLESLSAWELFDIVDVLLALLALAALAIPLAKAAGTELPIRPTNKALLTRIAVVVLTVTVAFFLEGADRGLGIFLALLAAIGMLYGAITMPGEDAPPRRRDRTRRPPADREFEQPPPGMESWRAGQRYGDEPAEEQEAGAPRGTSAGAGTPETRAGASEAPPRGEEGRPRRERSFDDPEPFAEPGSERTERRGPRRPPEAPPSRDG